MSALPTPSLLPLALLPCGCRAVIAALDESRPQSGRLRELGFLPGTTVHLVRRAPLGDPLALELRGCRLSMRHADALAVLVHRDAVPAVAQG